MNPRLRLGSIFFTLSSDFFLHILKSYSDIVQYLLTLKLFLSLIETQTHGVSLLCILIIVALFV